VPGLCHAKLFHLYNEKFGLSKIAKLLPPDVIFYGKKYTEFYFGWRPTPTP